MTRNPFQRSMVTRVVARFEAATRLAARGAMSPEKMQELLLKLRKGAGASLAMKQIIEVLNYLGGWKVEVIVGLVRMGLGDRPNYKVENSAEAAQKSWEHVKRDEVQSFPSSPTIGQRYTMDVTEPTVWPAGGSFKNDRFGFEFREYRGAPGVRVTSPEGETFEALPDDYEIDRVRDAMKLSTMYLRRWLMEETKFLEQVSNRLGLPTYEQEKQEKKPRTRSGAGTCPCCFRNIKLKGSGGDNYSIVLHGYERPGWGQVEGRCVGVGFPPFELSDKGTKHLVKLLHEKLESTERSLASFKSGRTKEIYDFTRRPPRLHRVEDEDPTHWARLVKQSIDRLETDVSNLKSDISKLEALISSWTEQPLPQEGEPIAPPPEFLR